MHILALIVILKMKLYDKICDYYKFVVKTETFVIGLDTTGIYLFIVTPDNFDEVLTLAGNLMKQYQWIPSKVSLCIINTDKRVNGDFYNLILPEDIDDFIISIQKKRSHLKFFTKKELNVLKKELQNDRIKDSSNDLEDSFHYDYSQTELWHNLDKYRRAVASKNNLDEQEIMSDDLLAKLIELRPSTIEQLQSFNVHRSMLIDVLGLIQSSSKEEPILLDEEGNEYQINADGGLKYTGDSTIFSYGYRFLAYQFLCIGIGLILGILPNFPWYFVEIPYFFSFIWASKFKAVANKSYTSIFTILTLFLMVISARDVLLQIWVSVILPHLR